MSGEVKQNTSVATGVIATAPSATESASNPGQSENPEATGAEWHNTTSGQIFICTDNTAGVNVWIGQKGTKSYGARGVCFAGSNSSGKTNTIQYITIPTTGDAVDFGDCSASYTLNSNQACSNGSSDRLVTGGGNNTSGVMVNIMEYVTATTASNSTDFGDLLTTRQNMTSTGSGTSDRGFFNGGYNASSGDVDVMQYITVSTAANAQDFGNLSSNNNWDGGCATSQGGSGDRAVVMGGGRGGARETIQYWTMSTLGNTIGFGDLTTTRYATSACSNESRAICSGGYQYPNGDAGAGYCTVSCDYITIDTTGNASVFGNFTGGVRYNGGGTDSGSYGDRGILCGGYQPGIAFTDIIDYCTISTTGNFTDFGDLLDIWGEQSMTSNGFS